MPTNYQYFCETCAEWLLHTEVDNHLETNQSHVIVMKMRYVAEGSDRRVLATDTPPPEVETVASLSPCKSPTNDEIMQTSNVWFEAIASTCNIDADGDYEIVVSFSWTMSSNKYAFEADVLIDDDDSNPIKILVDKNKYPKDSWIPATKVCQVALPAGSRKVSLVFRCDNKKGIASLGMSTISLRKVV
jgi:hypothetical protein